MSEWEGEEKKYGLMELCTIYGNPSIFVVVLCRMRGIKIENYLEKLDESYQSRILNAGQDPRLATEEK